MLGLGWGELLLIGIVALIVVGPKDLPVLFRQLGQFTGKARGMAREFSRAMEAAADEAGVKDIDRTIRAAADPMRSAGNALRDLTGLKTPASKPAVKPAAGTSTADLAAKRLADRAATAAAASAAKSAEPLPLTTPASEPATAAPAAAAAPQTAAAPTEEPKP